MESRSFGVANEQCGSSRTVILDTHIEDTTAFFEDIKPEDKTSRVLKVVAGDEMQFGDDEILNARPQTESDDVVEIPRGFASDDLSMSGGVKPEVELSCGDEDEKYSKSGKRVLKFLHALKRNPEWARSISFVKLTAAVPKNVQMDFAIHAFSNVNIRPKYLMMLASDMDYKDLACLIKKAFEQADDIPVEKTLFRLKCRNAVSDVRSLLRSLLIACFSTPALYITRSYIMGEMNYKGSKVRMRTSDLNGFCRVEEHGRALGIRFLTSFCCRSTMDNKRTLEIRYYDEQKKNGERVTYLHLDHEATNRQRVVFDSHRTEISFGVDTDEMTPSFEMNPPVYDLVELVVRLSCQGCTHH